MGFKNQKQLEKFLLNKCRLAMLKAQDEVYSIIKRFVYQYYSEFQPDEYIRTYQLLESLVQPRIVSDGKGYKAEIYFDVDKINYQTGDIEIQMTKENGIMGHASWDKDTILNVVMTGSYSGRPHGGYAEGTAIWNESKIVLDAEAINVLISMLKSEGIPIKIG